jgi:hypothetical protein
MISKNKKGLIKNKGDKMIEREKVIEFSTKYNQEKNQIIGLINDLALKMQEDSKKENKDDFLVNHKVAMETNKFEITFSFQDVRY